jgi:hypothetical protein
MKHAVLVVDIDKGLYLENITELRTGYVQLCLDKKDAIFEGNNQIEHIGIELKAFQASMRSISILADALVIEIFDRLSITVTAKTKKEETNMTFHHINITPEYLEIPRSLTSKSSKDLSCKDFEDYIKGCEQEHVALTKSSLQTFNKDMLLLMIKPTLFKTVTVTLYTDEFPVRFRYPIYKDGSELVLYLAQSG